MRYGLDDKFWVVVDPTPDSELGDVCFETTLHGLELQFRGGLSAAQNPTLFTDEDEAKLEAYGRLAATRAAEAVLRVGREKPGMPIDRIEIYGADGEVLYQAKLGQGR